MKPFLSTNKIIFRVDAQPEIGYGHFYRCLALARMVKEDFDISFAISNPCKELEKQLSDLKFDLIVLKKLNYSFPDNRKDNEEVAFDLEEYIDSFDIAVLDGYWFGQKYQSQLRTFNKKIVLIEDNGNGSYKADVLINPAEGLSEDDYLMDNEKAKKLLGSQYALLREPFLQSAFEIQNQKIKKSHIFICFGGSDILNKTLEITEWFLVNTSEKLHIVVGNEYPHIVSLKRIMSTYSNRVKLFKGLNQVEMVAEMKSAYLGVVPSSGILIECIACRLPVISGVYAENQTKNYQGYLYRDVLIPARKFKPSELKQAWNEVNDIKLRNITYNQIKLLDGQSGNRIRKIMRSLC